MEGQREHGIPRGAVEAFAEYLYEQECARLTVKKYCGDIRVFLGYLGEEQRITREGLLQYKEWLSGRYAVASVNSMLAALNRFLKYLGLGNLRVRRLRVQRQLFLQQEREMTEKEYARLQQEARGQGKKQLALLMETLAGTGARIGELSYFTVEQIRRGQVEIRHKGKHRRILLPGNLKARLLVYAVLQGIKKGPLFISKNGRPKDRSNIWREMKALGEKAGVQPNKIFPHNLRHLFARSYYQMTRDLAGLADLLGHSSLEVTRVYTAKPVKAYQSAVDRLGESRIKNTT
ncbi:MAG: tyrosine-type recombinase/integrase [Lachnospiraceae bacterium]|nr:tyrosine-type recombinase/integrase [Lachnospiraceae bacterium]